MNTEDSEFERIEREAARGVPDAIHHTDPAKSLEYITGWNDCRAAMLAEQPAQRTWVGLTDGEIEQGCKESWVTEQAWQSAVWWAEAKLRSKNENRN